MVCTEVHGLKTLSLQYTKRVIKISQTIKEELPRSMHFSKICPHILDNSLLKWASENGKIAEFQFGF